MKLARPPDIIALLPLVLFLYTSHVSADGISIRNGSPVPGYSQFNGYSPATNLRYGPVTSFSNSYGPITSFGHTYNQGNRFRNNSRFGNFNSYGINGYRAQPQINNFSSGYRQGFKDGFREAVRGSNFRQQQCVGRHCQED